MSQKKVFMVAEKPMLANSISEILSDGKKVTRKGPKQLIDYFSSQNFIFYNSSQVPCLV